MGAKGGGKSTNGTSGIPAEWRKMVQSLKEIVGNCTDQEIYATLRECNMDPDEAVNRLLTQDPFHEVKSKREKKKENKDPIDSRSRGPSIPPNRMNKGSTDRYAGRETGVLHSKPVYKKENGDHAGSSSASGQSGSHSYYQFPSHSNNAATENKLAGLGVGDGAISSSQSTFGYQSTWMGAQGQVSMADIVKMGKPQGKSSSVQNTSLQGASSLNSIPFQSAPSHQNFHSAQHQASTVSEVHSGPGIVSQQTSLDDEWPSIEPPQPVSISSTIESPAVLELHSNPANVSLDAASQHIHQDKVQVVEGGSVDTIDANHAAHASILGRNIQEDNSGGTSVSDNNLYEDMSSYLPHRHAIEHDEAEDGGSSLSANFQQLSIQKEDQGSPPEEDNPSVVIPHHLQLHTPDCFHLSFGSFGSGTNATFSGSAGFSNEPQNSNVEEISVPADVSSVGHSEARNSEYYEDGGTNSDGNLIHRTSASGGYYETPATQAEVKKESSESTQASLYAFPSSSPAFSYENNQPSEIPFIQNSSEMQNLERAMLAYTNNLSNNMLLASTSQTVREDPPYSPFPDTQSVPKYSNVASSITGPSMAMPEVLRTSSISTSQPTPQSNVAAGPALPQHLAVHPYSQPTLPVGHYTNMISYPFLPQSYTYMPSGFQQAFAGNSTYHQALAAVLPQYKNSISVSSLPQSAAIASGYGFGSSISIPGGNFPLNPPTAPAGSSIGYEDAISSQYKESNHLLSLQQNENPAMWIHGPGSRTMSAVPASAYYNLQGQNQQSSGFRQGQQPSQQFGALGYPNFYHSQAGMSLDGQQQTLRDASLGGSQGQQPKQSQQIWQNSY
ncbi:GBF-interacting protein 1, partial [Cucurbita argyrosperma subsp. sororia]